MPKCKFCGISIIYLEGVGWCDMRPKKNHGTFDICLLDGYRYSHYPTK